MKKPLYSWQDACLKSWFKNNGRGIVQAVTGSGKTVLALEAASRLEKKTGKKVLVRIVVPTAALMRQWNRVLREFMHNGRIAQGKIGLRGGGRNSSADCQYMIYVINSARYELARQILAELKDEEQVFLIADECHHYAEGQNHLIFEFIPYIKLYEKQFFSMGLSATLPTGQAQKNLRNVLGKCVYRYDIGKAVEGKTVCGYDVFHIELPFVGMELQEYQELTERIRFLYRKLLKMFPDLKGKSQKELYEILRIHAGDKKSVIAKDAALYMRLTYKRKELVCLAAARNRGAVQLIEMLGIEQKIIVFGERIHQADELYKSLKSLFPGRIGRYHSKMGNQANKNTLERFHNGELKILIACRSMDEGIDIPDASIGIILSGTSAERQRTQRLGRIIRKAQGKSKASLYYLHVAESAEEQCFLPNFGETNVFELKYDPLNGTFLNEMYDEAAEVVFAELIEKGVNQKTKQEAVQCLYEGSVRSDWCLEEIEIKNKIVKAQSIHEKNYWICMQKVREMKLK